MIDDAPHPIEVASYEVMASRVDLSHLPPGARDLVARMIYATADETFATSALVGRHAVDAALESLRAGGPVMCDSRMVAAGATALAKSVPVLCALDLLDADPPPGMTRSAAAFDAAAIAHPEGVVWAIGNAPTALDRLLELHGEGRVRPAAVVGLPVGYVAAADAKAALWRSPLQPVAVTNSGPRGGSAPAAAVLNALSRLL